MLVEGNLRLVFKCDTKNLIIRGENIDDLFQIGCNRT